MDASIIKIGTRGSKLALWQANHVASLIHKQGYKTHIEIIETKGDKILDKAIAKIGSKGIFTQELEEQLLNQNIDIAVHSAKDLQSELPVELEIIAFTEREIVNDVLVSAKKGISLTSPNLVIGTSSTRRVAMLKHYYPNIKTVDIRGNLQTRFRKMDEGLCDALLLAFAGVHRMEYDEFVAEKLPVDIFTPAVGQGSVAVEAAVDLSEEKRSIVKKAVNHMDTEICLKAERAFLKTLQGGCSIPVFGLATIKSSQVQMDGGIISLDGKKVIKLIEKGPLTDAESIGQKLALKVLETGGAEILKDIKSKLVGY
ncbi:MAG TPA: hydroxymethylbilane synthase [Cytophagales bacterium]|nr:hydroxymethylbilane synthase [Cytophagales bacterium]